jgi:flavin reductase (DIM6/NTAB) family NADH-FMN oxidoreductase RutF
VSSAPTPEQFRRAAGFLANGITVVTTRWDDVDHAMTANSFTTVSLEPVLVLVCAERQTRFHDAVLLSGSWAVSILDARAREAAVWFATKGRPLAGQLDHVAYTRGPETGAAVLGSSLAVVECVTTATHDGGDHTIVVGQVVSVDVPSVERADALGPLIYYRSGYRSLGEIP